MGNKIFFPFGIEKSQTSYDFERSQIEDEPNTRNYMELKMIRPRAGI